MREPMRVFAFSSESRGNGRPHVSLWSNQQYCRIDTSNAGRDKGGRCMGDDALRAAWEMNVDGADWHTIGQELGCTPEAARLMAQRYERDTDAAAAKNQFSLFDL